MKRRRHDRADTAGSRRRKRGPLTAHPLFAPVLGLWGAALGGLVTLVLPRAAVLEACAGIGLAQLGEKGPYVLAAMAAVGLGAALFALAVAIARRTDKARKRKSGPSIAAMALRQVQTIDPVSELGSASLDAPVEAMPFAGVEPAFVAEHADEGANGGDNPPAAATDGDDASEPAPLPPLELDLEEFGALPGRNAVWVEGPAPIAAPAQTESGPEPQSEPAPEPVPAPVAVATAARPAPVAAPVSPSAIERLRAVPTSELSLVQMVERFAAALHEHQSVPAGRAGHHADQAGRDAALAEALKALAALSEDGATTAQGEPLRAALSRLQELRGAA